MHSTFRRINIPVFSQLFSTVTQGAQFTIFEVFSFLVAIPMTAISKIITGQPPPTLQGFSQDVISFLFRMNAKTLAPDSNPAIDSTALAGAMQNLLDGEPTTSAQDAALQATFDATKTAASAQFAVFKQDLVPVARVLPTIVANTTVAIGVVIPVFTLGKALYQLGTAGQARILEESQAGKAGCAIGLTATILGGTMALIFPHPELPGKAPRIFSGFSPLTYRFFGTIQSARGTLSLTPPKKTPSRYYRPSVKSFLSFATVALGTTSTRRCRRTSTTTHSAPPAASRPRRTLLSQRCAAS